jgi:hypothetical protein
MPNQIIEFTTDRRFVRRALELKTIEAMLRLYCRGHGPPAENNPATASQPGFRWKCG